MWAQHYTPQPTLAVTPVRTRRSICDTSRACTSRIPDTSTASVIVLNGTRRRHWTAVTRLVSRPEIVKVLVATFWGAERLRGDVPVLDVCLRLNNLRRVTVNMNCPFKQRSLCNIIDATALCKSWIPKPNCRDRFITALIALNRSERRSDDRAEGHTESKESRRWLQPIIHHFSPLTRFHCGDAVVAVPARSIVQRTTPHAHQ